MPKNLETSALPKLRFPEFQGEWKVIYIDDICSGLISGKDKINSEGNIDLYGSTGLIGKTTSSSFNGNYILIARVGANAGMLYRVKGIFGATDNTLVLALKYDEIIDFIFFALEYYDLKRLMFGSGQPLVTAGQIKKVSLYRPTTLEQQKIADTLSSLDDLIAAESTRLQTYQAHKNGLMQALFPGEGETVPQVRFPEFEGDGEWEVKKLGEICTFINGRAYKQEELLEVGKYRVLRVGNFFSNNEWYYSDLELEENKYCDRGDLLYAWSASFGPRIWTQEKVIYHYHIWKVVEKDRTDKWFLFHLLNSVTEKIKDSHANGLGMLHITKGAIESWQPPIPTLPEQQKIANTLSSLDDLISAQTQKIEALRLQKKGLMQGLFPQSTIG